MREPPEDVPDAVVLAAVRTHWRATADAVEHLPVGFGAHHWRASDRGLALAFVTLDHYAARHTPQSLEAAYAGASQLSFAADFVVAPMPTGDGSFTVPSGEDPPASALSVTHWVHGERAGDGPVRDRAEAEAMLLRLHRVAPPARLPRWSPVVPVHFADKLSEQLAEAWTTGPYSERGRSALRKHLDSIRAWTSAYHLLADQALDRPWVATHGEPHTRNQMLTLSGHRVLVDWESLRLAPAERDLRWLVADGHGDLVPSDPEMVAMFDLEWRLDEVAQYASWFAAPHAGTDSDQVAFTGLLHALAGRV